MSRRLYALRDKTREKKAGCLALRNENKADLLVPKHSGVEAVFLYKTTYANYHVSKQSLKLRDNTNVSSRDLIR